MSNAIHYRVVRKLLAAEGYLELDLPARALQELQTIEASGVLEASRQLLTGEALKAQNRFSAALKPLQKAVATLPRPHSERALRSLNECFSHMGLPPQQANRVTNANDQLPAQVVRITGICRTEAGAVSVIIEISFEPH